MKSTRFHPNIIITGTPGCGKTSHAESLVSLLEKPYKHYNVSDLAKERKCLESYDDNLDTYVVDEDKLLDSLEEDLREGGAIVDWHCCDIFPERLIDLVVVLKTENSKLYDRLKKRGYKDNKIQENLDCEIMEVVWQDAAGAYIPEIVIPLASDSVEDMEENVERISAWVENWVKDHPEGVTNEIDPELLAQREAEEADDDEED
ncbi:CIC11C00000005102 [Sungouiella intermedia]|uniref:Adenylate kinase isoenzyme 6 homolog n=1 Tax=Sungouiella intermedia TaxID=45354 RepID=A0A1L0DFI0_9ASCO|nr:CIC11C00000005102 [[Candida] intermedia]